MIANLVVGTVLFAFSLFSNQPSNKIDVDRSFELQYGGYNLLKRNFSTSLNSVYSLEYKKLDIYRSDQPFFGGVYSHQYGISEIKREQYFIFFGFAKDFNIYKNFGVEFSFAPGIYFRTKAANSDLGFPVEFRSRFCFYYQVQNNNFITLGISHLSNANLSKINKKRNPGIDVFALGYKFFY